MPKTHSSNPVTIPPSVSGSKISLDPAVIETLSEEQRTLFKEIRRWSVRSEPILQSSANPGLREIFQSQIKKGQELMNSVEEADYTQEIEESLITQISGNLIQLSVNVPTVTVPAVTVQNPVSVNCDSSSSSAHQTYTAVRIMNELLSTVPVFTGDITRFAEFRRLFDRAVHNLDDVPDEIKHEKLLSKLSPEIRSSFVASVHDGSNYTQLYEALCTENTSKYRLARSSFAKRTKIPKLFRETIPELDSFVTEARSWVGLMKDLPTDNLADYLIFEALFMQLSPVLKDKFNREKMENGDVIPSYVDLMTFMERELRIARMLPADQYVRSQASSSLTTTPSKRRSPSPCPPSRQRSPSSRSTTKNTGASYPILQKENRGISCHHCQGAHHLYRCQAFKKLSVEERSRLVDLFGACRNCFSQLHKTTDCRSERRCHCGHAHHPWLHLYENHTESESLESMAESRVINNKNTPVSPSYSTIAEGKPTRQAVTASQLRTQDCLHLQLYRDSKDRYKQGQTKASLSLQHFLGVETGFTLDKESNTIAILCQDVTVVLAFDTRERLIQWQVKIANNLGEDQQFLVQISSAPPKAKIASGPARLHVQEYRFCMTLGVPPRLVGIWEISKLRRYGVVESRFCFEGGSRCGKGEGLYVLITDQGEEITKTLQAASEGKMTARRRPASRNMSVMDSPRKCSTRMSSVAGDTMSLCQRSIADSMECQSICRSVMTNADEAVWPSSETSGPVSDFGDTASVGDFHDPHPQDCSNWSVERCASCISKLGAMSMSRSSTAGHTPGNGFSPAWVMETSITSLSNGGGRERANTNPGSSAMSVSSHDSGSDYSVPRLQAANDSWSCRGPSPCECDGPPSRPPKSDQVKQNVPSTCAGLRKKPPMPLPHHNYGNYDVPKSIFPVCAQKEQKPSIVRCSNGGVETVAGEYYDTPKALKECLAYSNYDRPPSIHPGQVVSGGPGWCLAGAHQTLAGAHQTRVVLEEDRGCPCRRLVCWPSSWISLPYCRRGNSVENTSVHLQKVKLNGEGKMPMTNNPSGLAIYATIDKSKKTKYKKEGESKEDKENEPKESDVEMVDGPNSNYVNVEPSSDKEALARTEIPANYENLDFAHSLEYYENAKDVLQRAGIAKEDLPGFCMDQNGVKFCTKCGHACAELRAAKIADDYLMMEPQNQKPSSKYPGYLPMHPSTKSESGKCWDMKSRLARGLNDRAASIPSLIERSRRSDSDMRVPGSAMLGMNHPQSANSSPYLTRRNPVAVTRKRSSSADSTRYDDDEVTLRCSQETVDSLPRPEEELNANGSVQSVVEANDSLRSVVESVSQDSTAAVPVRRSSSVPCKPANRDSSSSNDSGVSTGSLKHRGGDFAEFELPLTTSMSSRRHLLSQALHASQDCCLHASLPRRSKSSDPLKELSFQFPRVKVPAKSSSAEAEIPICHNKREPREYSSPNSDGAIVVPYIDSRSTSSGTSDMSDYIETLSMSSHSSSDTPDSLRLGRVAVTTLRPRSGKEYHKIDRYILDDVKMKGLNTMITTVPEKSESPSPGYMSSSPGN